MHTLLVIIHASAMVVSFGLMSGALILGFLGKKIAAFAATLATIGTAIGGVSGVILLLGAPLSWQCATLTAYLIIMSALYIFGFGMGIADDARLIRS